MILVGPFGYSGYVEYLQFDITIYVIPIEIPDSFSPAAACVSPASGIHD